MTTELLNSPQSKPSRHRSAAAPGRRPRRIAEPGPTSETRQARERAALLERNGRQHLRWNNVDWVVLTWMIVMHVGAVAALFFFTWQALVVAVALHWLTCSIGVCLGYHRFLSHRSLKLVGPARFLVTLCGVISGEGSPLAWAATHRAHHAHSDEEGDPHSPLDGPWWSHLLWMFVRRDEEYRAALYQRYVPDLARDPILRFFERTYGMWLVATGVVLFALGGWPILLWGLCLRMVFAYHSTWFVNSATHLWGYRSYETSDESRNLWWVALASYGEGWHNNHHAYPRLARAGHRWWELDMTFWAIRLLQGLGLAYEVNDRRPELQSAANVSGWNA